MTTTLQRVFCARLSGLVVFDPNGDQVGRVRDVVATLRVGGQPPRVLGLVVDVQRRRIFVPILRVRSFDSSQVVLTSGTVSLRRFERRTSETLVLEDLLDRKVQVLETGTQVVVYDCAMEQTRTGDWQLTRVAVRSGGVRRRGHQQELRWDEVSGFAAEEHGQGATNLLAMYEGLRPADLANELHNLSDKRRMEVAAALDDERLADVLEELPEDEQVEIIETLDNERAADVLEAMAPDDAADLLSEMPEADAARLLELMEPDEAEPVRRLLLYADNTAGGLMTTEPIILLPNATVAEALAHVRNPELSPALASQVYVCRPPTETPTGRFLGICHIQRLLREPPSALVSSVADTDLDPLGPDASLRAVTQHLATYNLTAVPIVDEGHHLLGAVTVDDVLDHLLPDNWREEEVGGAVL
ncbi:MAG TPA: CBS domain-containing protein [Mycobacteriales bacterium]|jgi:flagellar motility protein MotE (MotC chaperone)|nr:CBS domain-containing protein [Mycobacteriales bacterium]